MKIMKKIKMLSGCLMIGLILNMTGCGGQIPDMTEEEQKAISEYSVELLLKYNADDSSRLVDLELLEKEPEPTKAPQATPIPTKTPEGMDEVADTPILNKGEAEVADGNNMKAVFDLPESISFEYVDYQVEDKYVDLLSKDLEVKADSGNKLLICNCVLMNDGADKQSVDMLLHNIKYIMNVDGTTINCSVTMLSNDLTTYLGILDADEARKVIVVAEGKEELLTNAEKIYLEVQREDLIATIQIK